VADKSVLQSICPHCDHNFSVRIDTSKIKNQQSIITCPNCKDKSTFAGNEPYYLIRYQNDSNSEVKSENIERKQPTEQEKEARDYLDRINSLKSKNIQPKPSTHQKTTTKQKTKSTLKIKIICPFCEYNFSHRINTNDSNVWRETIHCRKCYKRAHYSGTNFDYVARPADENPDSNVDEDPDSNFIKKTLLILFLFVLGFAIMTFAKFLGMSENRILHGLPTFFVSIVILFSLFAIMSTFDIGERGFMEGTVWIIVLLTWFAGQPIEDELRAAYGLPALSDEASVNNNVGKNDIEIIRLENGDIYEGTLYQSGEFKFGKYTWTNGSYYEGRWFLGKRMGSGKFTFSTGNSCQGEYMFNKLSGYGLWESNLESEPEFCFEVDNEFRVTTLLKAYRNLASGDERWKTSTLFDAIIHSNEERKEYTVLENYILSEGLIANKLAEEQQAESDRIAELRRQKAYSEKLEKERIAEAKRKEKRAKKLAKARRREYIRQRNREDERAYSEYMAHQERIERNISRREMERFKQQASSYNDGWSNPIPGTVPTTGFVLTQRPYAPPTPQPYTYSSSTSSSNKYLSSNNGSGCFQTPTFAQIQTYSCCPSGHKDRSIGNSMDLACKCPIKQKPKPKPLPSHCSKISKKSSSEPARSISK